MGGGGERGLGVMGVGAGIQKSPSLLRNGSLQSNNSSASTVPGEGGLRFLMMQDCPDCLPVSSVFRKLTLCVCRCLTSIFRFSLSYEIKNPC